MSPWDGVELLQAGGVPFPGSGSHGYGEDRILMDSPLLFRVKRCSGYLMMISWAYREAFAISEHPSSLKAFESRAGRLSHRLEDEEALAVEPALGKLVADFEEVVENHERRPGGGYLTKNQWKAIRLNVERLLRDFHEEVKRASKLKLLVQRYFVGAVYFPEQARMTLDEDENFLDVVLEAGGLRDKLFEEFTSETLAEYFRVIDRYSLLPDYELWVKSTKEFFGDFTLSLEDCRELREEIEVQVLWNDATAVV